jgi:hypothetical protein
MFHITLYILSEIATSRSGLKYLILLYVSQLLCISEIFSDDSRQSYVKLGSFKDLYLDLDLIIIW